MLPGLYDIYVLSSERSASVLNRFLSSFASQREDTAEDFMVQDTALGLEQVFVDGALALDYCLTHSSASASFYWRCLLQSPACAMAFFTEDGALILGLSTNEAETSTTFAELRSLVGGAAPGYVCFEEPPPTTISEFLDRVHHRVE